MNVNVPSSKSILVRKGECDCHRVLPQVEGGVGLTSFRITQKEEFLVMVRRNAATGLKIGSTTASAKPFVN